jgi:cbb3-type cytochrome oxidase maturation protein
MEVIYLLIAFSLLVALIFLGLFFWAVKSGQFDDQYTPSIRMLFDEKKKSKKQTTNKNNRDE